MELKIGSVVLSRAGRDKGRFMAVTGIEDCRVIVCDGKERPLGRQKSKNTKHIAVTGYELSEYDMAADSRLRRALHRISEKSAQGSERWEDSKCQSKI